HTLWRSAQACGVAGGQRGGHGEVGYLHPAARAECQRTDRMAQRVVVGPVGSLGQGGEDKQGPGRDAAPQEAPGDHVVPRRLLDRHQTSWSRLRTLVRSTPKAWNSSAAGSARYPYSKESRTPSTPT